MTIIIRVNNEFCVGCVPATFPFTRSHDSDSKIFMNDERAEPRGRGGVTFPTRECALAVHVAFLRLASCDRELLATSACRCAAIVRYQSNQELNRSIYVFVYLCRGQCTINVLYQYWQRANWITFQSQNLLRAFTPA